MTLYNFSETHLNPKIQTEGIFQAESALENGIEFSERLFLQNKRLKKKFECFKWVSFGLSETQSMKKLLRETISEIAESPSAIQALMQIVALPKSDNIHNELSDLKDIFELVKLASAHLHLIFSQRQATDFTQQTLDAPGSWRLGRTK